MEKKIFTLTKSDIEIYEKKIKNFLPDHIIDSHVHLWLKEHILFKEVKPNNSFNDFDAFQQYSFEEFSDNSSEIFQDKKYTGIFFGNPLGQIDIEKVNKYILKLADTGEYCLYIPSPEDKLEGDTFNKIKGFKNFLGFKPYPSLAKKENNEVSIHEFLNEYVLDYANSKGLFILLHLPRKKRLADHRNIEEVKYLTKKYPDVKFLLAHLGRSYCLGDISEAVEQVSKIENLFFEISFVNDWEIFELVIKKIGCKRIIFGSDMPVSLMKGKNICINDNHYFVTEKLFSWSISNNDMQLNFTFFLYEQIREFIKALNKLGLCKDAVLEDVFYGNIKKLIDRLV
ncbi:MAG: amidohydrolase family protein [Actinobacteria bacterium]|nr:amidohydrolase family protein [Actinomycetota bacterium]